MQRCNASTNHVAAGANGRQMTHRVPRVNDTRQLVMQYNAAQIIAARTERVNDTSVCGIDSQLRPFYNQQDLRGGLVNLPLRLRQRGTFSVFGSTFSPKAKMWNQKRVASTLPQAQKTVCWNDRVSPDNQQDIRGGCLASSDLTNKTALAFGRAVLPSGGAV